MEKTEPTLVPEWLKNAGSSPAGISASHSDDQSSSRGARNKSSVNSNGHDFGRSSSSERTTSSYFRRSSSSNSSGSFRSYTSFGRNQRDRDREKDAYDFHDQDNSLLGGRRHRNFSDPLGDTSLSKFERDGLRRSQSMISGKRGDAWPKKVVADPGSASVKISNGLLSKGGPVAGVSKTSFERDFPSLRVGERAVISDNGKVPSPVLSTAIQSLPIGTSASIGGEKWTSALAEVPILVAGNGPASLSVHHTTSSSSSSVVQGSTTSLNMAEAVAQGPNRVKTTPQLSVGAQRLEELAIKQSRQLIPVTPSIPKTLVLNSSDKHKSKVGSQQHSIASSLTVNHSPRGGPVNGDVPKTSNVGKLHVLNPVREKNGITPVVKDNMSPTSGSSLAASPFFSGSTPTRPTPNSTFPDRKPVTLLEKRGTAHTQSRNDFFDLMRKQSLGDPASADSAAANASSFLDTGSAISPSISDKNAVMEAMPATTPPVEVLSSLSLNVDSSSEEKAGSTCNGDAYDVQKCVSNGKKDPRSNPISSEEEETVLLRSMGWEENNEEGGLTDEEISAYFKDLSKLAESNLSPRILQQLVQLKFLTPFDSQLEGIDEISSELSSSSDDNDDDEKLP